MKQVQPLFQMVFRVNAYLKFFNVQQKPKCIPNLYFFRCIAHVSVCTFGSIFVYLCQRVYTKRHINVMIMGEDACGSMWRHLRGHHGCLFSFPCAHTRLLSLRLFTNFCIFCKLFCIRLVSTPIFVAAL